MLKRKTPQFRNGMTFLQNRLPFIIGLNSVLVCVSFLCSWTLRLEFHLPQRSLFLITVPILISIRIVSMAKFDLLHGWWHYAGVNEAVDIAKSVLAGSVVFLIVVRYALGLRAVPLSVYFTEAVLTAFFLASVRIFSRLIVEAVRVDGSGCKKVAIIGAGFAAQMVIRELNRPGSDYIAVACFDDDRSKRGIKIHGVPVVSAIDGLAEWCIRLEIDEVLIAIPSATGAQMHRFLRFCEGTGLRFKTVPTLRDLIAGNAQISQLRDVNVEDLLAREPVNLDIESLRKDICGRVVMVTGAAGSIGSELSRQILDYEPGTLICVDHNENGMFYLDRELSSRINKDKFVCVVADIGNADRMRKLCTVYGVDLVFHAAAYKHVPVMENNIQEAVSNNIFSLLRFLDVAEEAGCQMFLMISSDKAVNPTSIMGCTKRVGELIISAWPRKSMRCVSVRFGNVLGSSGSVIPVFREQLARNEPLTITHPDIERFFMTIPEAVALVLQASVLGKHGDILVLDMGEPMKIVDLARTLIRLSGRSLSDVELRFTGLRNGEKLSEELFYSNEDVQGTRCEKIKRVTTSTMRWPQLYAHLEDLKASLYVDGADPIRSNLLKIVPECQFPDSVSVDTAKPMAMANYMSHR